MEPIDKPKINGIIHQAISDQHIEDYFKGDMKNQLIEFSDLRNYKTIDDLLPDDRDYCVILVETSDNVGHWVCMTKDKASNTITFFDSYGIGPGDQLKFIDPEKNKQLNQDKNYLRILLKKSKYKVVWNKIEYQNESPNVKNCGRYCILFLVLFKEKGYDLKQFQQFMKQQTKRLKLTSDQLVSYLIK